MAVDWAQALNIGKSLLLSPIVGFVGAVLLLSLMKVVVKNRKLYEAPDRHRNATVLDFALCWS